jgi:hypothetical protein
MTQENVVVVRFTEPSKAYQALSVLKECDAEGRIGLKSAAIVERTSQGELRIPESADNLGLVGMASGSLIGMLVGVLRAGRCSGRLGRRRPDGGCVRRRSCKSPLTRRSRFWVGRFRRSRPP